MKLSFLLATPSFFERFGVSGCRNGSCFGGRGGWVLQKPPSYFIAD